MRLSFRLIAAVLILFAAESATRALAATPSFSIADAQCQVGMHCVFTITKTGAALSYSDIGVASDISVTSSGSAGAPINTKLRFLRAETVKTVATQGISPGTFKVSIRRIRNALIARPTATGTVTAPPAPVPVPTPTPPPPQPTTETCPDGTVVQSGQICPTPPPVVVDPPGSPNNPMKGQSPGVGAPPIPTTDHDVMKDLMTSWATHTPGEAKPDVVGAFRFVCRHNSSKFDDHIVFYQKPGASHLHDSTGLYSWDAFTNYGNSRRGGGNSCSDTAGQDKNPAEINWAANHTSYIQPALEDGRGNVINADLTEFYYKRRPITDPIVSDPANPRYQGKAVPLPNGIKFIFGNHPEIPSAPFDSANTKFMCTSSATNFGSDMLSALKACQGSATGQFEVRSEAPSCWDGDNLDSADHRSHVSYASYGSWGYLKCDAAHPYVIPSFTYAVQYTIAATDDVTLIHFSSDIACMALGKPQGCSFHVDYGPAAWDPVVLNMWENGCVDQLLNCSGGDLGNGLQIKGAAKPIYLINGVYTAASRNPQRLTPIPPSPAMPMIMRPAPIAGERGKR